MRTRCFPCPNTKPGMARLAAPPTTIARRIEFAVVIVPSSSSPILVAPDARLAHIAKHAGMQQLPARRRRDGVGHGGLACLLQARGERPFCPVNGAGQQIRSVFLKTQS